MSKLPISVRLVFLAVPAASAQADDRRDDFAELQALDVCMPSGTIALGSEPLEGTEECRASSGQEAKSSSRS